MIADCAIDPEIFAEWRHFQSLYEDFGVHRGRLISRFPKSWPRLLLEYAGKYVKNGKNSERQRSMIEARLKEEKFGLRRKMISPRGRTGPQDGDSWLDAVCRAEPPFDLIIAKNAKRSLDTSVSAEDFMKDEAPFARPTQIHTPRKKEHLVGVASLLLSCSKEIVLVDPNLRPDEKRFYNTIIHLMKTVDRVPCRFEIHTKRILKPSDDFHPKKNRRQWEYNILPNLPDEWHLTACYWDTLPKEGKPHARFLLTERGGLHYDYGLDEGEGETLVTLLDENIWEELFLIYKASNVEKGFVFQFP